MCRKVLSHLSSVGLADAVQTVESPTGLAARHHPRLHVAAGEVLQLVVDVQVPDAAVEAGRVEGLWGETQRGGQHLLRHPWRHTESIHSYKSPRQGGRAPSRLAPDAKANDQLALTSDIQRRHP